MKSKSARPPVQFMDIDNNWREDYEKNIGRLSGKLVTKDLEFYRKCYYNDLTLNIGDFVLIYDVDSEYSMDVAKIIYMYEDKDPGPMDPCRALVKWYTHPESLKKYLKNDKTEFHATQEVIENDLFDNDISIETIVQTCSLKIIKVNDESIEKMTSKSKRNYFCRYKLVRIPGKRQYMLEPMIGSPKISLQEKTPSKRKTLLPQDTVMASPKLIIRRLSTDMTPNKRKTSLWTCEQKLSPIRDTDEIPDLPKSTRKTRQSVDREMKTPSKHSQMKEIETPTSRRKSILKTPNAKGEGTPRKRVSMSARLETQYEIQDEENITPPKQRKIEGGTPRGRPRSTQKSSPTSTLKGTPRRKIFITRFPNRSTSDSVKTDGQALQLARERLHVAAVPKTLPCRNKEFENIYAFLEGKLLDNCGGCMYVSGVPGTGKTATTTEVIRTLKAAAEQDDVPEFDFIEINGMRLTEPRQAYVHIYRQFSGKTVSAEYAYNLLDKRFTTPSPKRKMTILLVDELDILCNRRQDVVYNILNWPTLPTAKLVVVTIANTMDLPERLLMGKITSRLGLTRLTFQPYNFQQLQEIITARVSGTDTFNKDAIQLVARKVAAVSGDARRALDICRRATEIAESGQKTKGEIHVVSIADVQKALTEMIASAKMQAIKSCSKYEQMWLQAVCAEVARTGVEECTFIGVYHQFESIAAFNGVKIPNPGQALGLCAKLGAIRLLITEHSRTDLYMKILLNISSDDVHYALQPSN
ncbi:LOW QUALITY PROTEIN: origin recognition complex subunit 1 [Culicoides brevitarsis]|uniref:LOW QUALITY PROTEIN: origin recognition complex subunit 1 n=1 Tax=Culicoides brevitarsis TaxID=469753 RepID=UPI00307C62D5